MKRAYVLKNCFEKTGNTVYLTDGDWTSSPFYACVGQLWRRKSSAFEPEYTQIGTESREYYIYFGPYDHDITALSNDGRVVFDGTDFVFTRRDCIKVDDEVLYYTGILKKIKESELVEY